VFREVEETMAAGPEETEASGEPTVTRSRFVISEKALKPPVVAPAKGKAHKRPGIGADTAAAWQARVIFCSSVVTASAWRPVPHVTISRVQ
jgi:hypothetical protein